MTDTNEVFEKAVSIVKEAITAEQEGNYKLAHSKYVSSLEYFVHTLKYEKNPQKKALIKTYADSYMVMRSLFLYLLNLDRGFIDFR